jgi:N-hydroxyarylamine O-acetyltransferase
MATIDVDAYFRRIGYTGERVPTLAVLRAVHLRHVEAIPFENLNPLLKRPVRLDPASVEQKLVRDRRGGYCFEQNRLFRDALEALGFRVAGLCARALWNAPEGVTMPRSHMLLRVEVGADSYLADVGFGGQTLTGPLRLVPEVAQDTPHERFRLRPTGEELVMEAELRGAWRPLYRFDLSEPPPIDYEVANWYVSTCPASFFTSTLIAARVAPGARHALRDNELAVHTRDGTERRALTSAAELREALTDVFGIALPEGPELDAALERVAAKPRPVV